MNLKVEWTQRAITSLDYFYSIIANNSPTSAKKVKQEIVLTSKKLANNPYLYQLDEYYPDNPGNIRRYFRWSYRIVYQVLKEKVVVLEVYHSATNPKA